MALEGTLEDFSLADIFQLIGIQRKSGILTLKNPEETISVRFYNGMVVGADSSAKKLEDRIGKVLVKTGLITAEELKEALELQQKTLQKIGYILINQKYITREQLREALQIQTAQMLYKLFRWHTGEYYFDQKAKIDPEADDNISPMSAESILLEGIQMIDEWPLIQKKIPNYGIVFRPTVQMEDLDLSTSDEEDDMRIMEPKFGLLTDEAEPKVRLSHEEAEIFRLLNGKNTVNDVIECSKHGEFYTCKALYDLLERKIIEQVSMTAAPAAKEKTHPYLIKKSQTKNLGFLYVVLAAAVAGILVWNAGDPLKLFAWRFLSKHDLEQLNASLNMNRFHLIDSTVLMYFYVNGKLPQKLEDLVEKSYLRASDIVDPWSKSYSYEVNGNTYVLSSDGKEGRPESRFLVRRSVTTNRPASEKVRSSSQLRVEN
jgi:hypothetical protein